MLKVGDRVKAIHFVDGLDMTGRTGRVVVINPGESYSRIGVEFDRPFTQGHECYFNGKGYRNGCCRWGNESEFFLISRTDLVDGRVVAPTCECRHVFRPGDRVVKLHNKGPFTTRAIAPGAKGTIWWAGDRPGHYPHLIVILDPGFTVSNMRGLESSWDEAFYGVPSRLATDRTFRNRMHTCPVETVKYIGQRVNLSKIA